MINPNIPLQSRTPNISLEPLMKALAFRQQREGQKQQQQANEFKFQQAQAEEDKKKSFQDIMQSSLKITPKGKQLDKQSFLGSLMEDGRFGEESFTLQKQFADEDYTKRKRFLDNHKMEQDAKNGIIQEKTPYLDALSDPKERAGILRDEWKIMGLDWRSLPESIDDEMLEQMKAAANPQTNFAPTRFQSRIGEDGVYMGFDPATNTFSQSLDAQGQPVKAPEGITYKENSQGEMVPFPTKRPPSSAPFTAPAPMPGFKSAGAEKRKVDTENAQIGLQKAQIDLDKAVLAAGQGGNFKTTQYKAASFGMRMEQVEGVLDKLSSQGFDPSEIKNMVMKGGTLEAFKSGPQKAYAQAMNNFINATLREESGAAIADSEFEKADRQYFAGINDGPEAFAQKKNNRHIIQARMLAEAGGAYDETLEKYNEISNPKKQPMNTKPLKGKPKNQKSIVEDMTEEEIDAETKRLGG